jgi:hypothetical protein
MCNSYGFKASPRFVSAVDLLAASVMRGVAGAGSRVASATPGLRHVLMEVIGADGVHIGTVDRVEGNRIKLTKKDSGEGRHRGHHHYIDKGLVADIEGNKVRLSANAAVAVMMEEEK